MKRLRTFVFLALISLLAACQAAPVPTAAPAATATLAPELPTQTPAPTEIPERALVVCLAEEPATLYPYGGSSRSMWNVLEALYDGPFDTLAYSSQPVILEKMPSLADGDALLEPVVVRGGEPVVDANGALTALAQGLTVLPSGCSSPDCAVTWDGASELRMDRLVVTFHLKPGLQWSDGAPLTAADSVYSFQLAADPATPVSKGIVDRTASYTASDDRSTQWTGIPGYTHANYATHFWLPLPLHAWQGKSAADLLADEDATHAPIGWGPYVIEEWTAGDHITLRKNPLYFRAAEGLPKFERLVYRFLGDPADTAVIALVSQECDVVEDNPGFTAQLRELILTQYADKLQFDFTLGPEWEHLDFGIRPASYDDGFDLLAGDRPDLFGDVRTRQALAACIDRQKIVSELFFDRSQVPLGTLPPDHPLYQADLPAYPYDPAEGSRLLDEVGWKDSDGDPATPRVAQGIPGVPDGTPLQLNYITTQAALREDVAELINVSLADCGVGLNRAFLNPGELYAPGPDGPLFGRKFDLAAFTWQAGSQPGCGLFTSAQIPSAANRWVGTNVTGFSDPVYDAACAAALWTRPDQPDYASRVQDSERAFAESLPVLPLYYQLRIAISRVDLCGLQVDSTTRSLLWNLESIDYGAGCAN
jgi:peptide/nickel transport system substrate-binding protein